MAERASVSGARTVRFAAALASQSSAVREEKRRVAEADSRPTSACLLRVRQNAVGKCGVRVWIHKRRKEARQALTQEKIEIGAGARVRACAVLFRTDIFRSRAAAASVVLSVNDSG